mgnify:CR=1 FL=1
MYRFENKIAVVTEDSRGVGKGIEKGLLNKEQ